MKWFYLTLKLNNPLKIEFLFNVDQLYFAFLRMSLIFQVIDWRTYQAYVKGTSKTIIQIFGKTEKGESVMVEVDDYYSSFYTLASEEKIKKCKTTIKC